MQVQVVDQTTHPPKCHSFVGLDRQIGSSPPAVEKKLSKSKRIPMITRVTHTHVLMAFQSILLPRKLMSGLGGGVGWGVGGGVGCS